MSDGPSTCASHRQGVVILLRHEGRYLFAKRGPGETMPGRWALVAGGVEAGESEQQTAVREAREEVGIEIHPVRKLRQGVTEDGRIVLHYWLAQLVSGQAHVACEEVVDICWVDLAGARALPERFDADIELIEALEAEQAE